MYKVDNAIILAAGRGSRLKHLTNSIPKPLLAPNGERFIDGIIKNLRAKNINDITVVTGYLGDQFNYLKKDGIKLINNMDWDKGNNVTSVKASLDILKNTLLINGDIIMEENVFQNEYPYSLTYVEKNENIDEWFTIFNDKGNVIDFDKNGLNKKGYYQREIIFITRDLSNSIKKEMINFDMQEYQEFLMLKTAEKENIPFKIFEIRKNIVYDLDTVEEFENYKNK